MNLMGLIRYLINNFTYMNLIGVIGDLTITTFTMHTINCIGKDCTCFCNMVLPVPFELCIQSPKIPGGWFQLPNGPRKHITT